jgi:hypothetical protein
MILCEIIILTLQNMSGVGEGEVIVKILQFSYSQSCFIFVVDI